MAIFLATSLHLFIDFLGLKVLNDTSNISSEECASIDAPSNCEVSEEFSDLDERVVEEGWVLLADMSSDRRRDAKPAYTGIYSGLNPAHGPSPCATSGDSYAYIFFTDLRLHAMNVDYHWCPLFIAILSFPFACYIWGEGVLLICLAFIPIHQSVKGVHECSDELILGMLWWLMGQLVN